MTATPHPGALVEIEISDIAHGGEGVGRVAGKAHFVAGAIPGELVVARISKDAGSWARAELVEVRTASPDRIEPPCPHAADCGGCQWQHADYAAQLRWKRDTIAAQLRHLGRIESPPVTDVVRAGPSFGYRNRMDFRVQRGTPALYRPRSHARVALGRCDLLDPNLAALFHRLGDLGGVERLTMRTGTNTGDTLVIIAGSIPRQAEEWGTAVAHRDGRKVSSVLGSDEITEQIGERRFRISKDAFFQNNSHAAAALVRLVHEALEPEPTDTLLDAYAGVGLFGVGLADSVGRVVAVESHRLAVSDLRHNLGATGVDHNVIRGKMETVAAHLDEYPQLVVADPPRSGLGEQGIAAVTAAAPRRLAYVSCDPASLARDAPTLVDHGYGLERVVPVDMFPQTFHIEAVATFVAG